MISIFVCVYVHFFCWCNITMLWLHTECQRQEPKEKLFSFFFFKFFFFCGGVPFSATARVQLCVKKNQAKYWKGGCFTQRWRHLITLILKREFRYVLSPPHCNCRHLRCGGESPRFGHVWRSPPASCSTLVAGNKFGSAENYKNFVLKREGLRECEIRPIDGIK